MDLSYNILSAKGELNFATLVSTPSFNKTFSFTKAFGSPNAVLTPVLLATSPALKPAPVIKAALAADVGIELPFPVAAPPDTTTSILKLPAILYTCDIHRKYH